MTQVAGFNAAIYAAAQNSVAFTNEAMTDSGDHINYTITNTAKRYWDDGVTVTAQESTDSGGTWHAAPATFALQYCGGKLIYTVARNAAYLYRVSGSYLPITQITDSHEWSLQIETALLNATVFGLGWQQLVDGVSKASATLMRFWNTDNYFWNQLTANTKLVVVLYTNFSVGSRYEMFAWVPKTDTKTPQMALVDNTITVEASGPVYYLPS